MQTRHAWEVHVISFSLLRFQGRVYIQTTGTYVHSDQHLEYDFLVSLSTVRSNW